MTIILVNFSFNQGRFIALIKGSKCSFVYGQGIVPEKINSPSTSMLRLFWKTIRLNQVKYSVKSCDILGSYKIRSTELCWKVWHYFTLLA